MCDCHDNCALLGDGRGSWPWPDIIWLSRHQDRRRFSGLAGGVVGRSPGLASEAHNVPNLIPETTPGAGSLAEPKSAIADKLTI